MNSGNSADSPSGDFTERLVDGFFRHWVLYLAPVVLLAAVGLQSTRSITAEYESYARLSATTNPYLEPPDIRGTEIGFYETPAEGTARLINEQLQTDTFIDDIALRAGLVAAINDELITRDDIRDRVAATPGGQNNLRVGATWADPETAFRLVEGTTSGYSEYLAGLAVADSEEAVSFWTERRESASQEAEQAQVELDAYVDQLAPIPDGQDEPTGQVLEIQRLNSALDRALESVRLNQAEIDKAQFTLNQAESTSARQLEVIDAPAPATAPASVRLDKIVAVTVFTLLGLLVSFAALVMSTVADRAIRTRSQLRTATNNDVVAVIPRVKDLRRQSNRQRSKRVDETDRAA